MSYHQYIFLIPLLPLCAFVLLGLFGRKYFNTSSGIIGTATLFASTALSLITAYNYFFGDGKANGVYRKMIVMNIEWLQFSPNISINLGILLDPISVMMIVIVCFISLMVHVFSLGYMKGEKRFATYYAFLSLFTFSMLGLVLSSNIFQIYMFWELVGVSSYLLIGFYFDKPSAVAASKKAFIVTRFADFGFLIGILILAFYGGSLDFGTLIERLTAIQSAQFISISTASFAGITALTWGLTLVFIGGAGKSAMFPLHIWLPDAMEGPTPVSALIHAATMVVAGVFLVARLFPIFSMDGAVLNLVTWVGVVSAFIAAVIACTQTDIKRILAFSTMSQIGYMMFALGVSGSGGEENLGYMASMFHLFTHAFFKSLLFLGAGAIIHQLHTNNIELMGGLRKLMPVTHITFLIACLAIAGIPPLAGFFSKEEILLAAYQSNKLIYLVALITAVLTSFYMFRLYFSVFWKVEAHPIHHEEGNGHSERSLFMKVPLIILAFCSVVAGFVPFAHFVTANGEALYTHVDILFSVVPVSLSIIAILIAGKFYKNHTESPAKLARNFGGVYTAVKNQFYVDELYLFINKKFIFQSIGRPAAWIDRNIVDGAINGLAHVTASVSGVIKYVQSGKVQGYALYFFAGVAGLAIVFIYWWR